MSEGSQNSSEHSESIEEQLEKLKATNARLLEESQAHKQKRLAVEQQLEDFKAKEAEKAGDLSAQLEIERARKAKLEAEYASTRKKVLHQAAKEKISRYAGEVYNLDDVISTPIFGEFYKQGIDEENLDFKDDVAKSFVETLKKEKPYFFKSSNPIPANTGRPSAGVNNVSVDLSKMSNEELKEFIKQNYK